MLTVCTKSTDADLTTTGALKLRLFGSTSDTTVSDAVLNALIKAASRWAEGFVGYPLTLQTYEERIPTYGTRSLMVARTPVRALRLYESTEADAYELTSTQFVLDPDAGLVARDEGWPWTVPTELDLEERPLPGEESAPWFARYQAGYVGPGGLDPASNNYSTHAGSTDTGRTLPEDVEEAVLLKARSVYEQSVLGGSVRREKLGDLEVEYQSGGDSRGAGAEALSLGPAELLLAPYRRVV